MATIAALRAPLRGGRTTPTSTRGRPGARTAAAAARPGARVATTMAVWSPTAGKSFANVEEAVKSGLLQGCAPFPDGVDAFGFFNGIDEAEAQRFADVEITHGRVAMLAALGFLVGEQVEGSSFLFDSNVTGPAINHFQQVPPLFWGLLGAGVFFAESTRVQTAWQNPFEADKLFLLKPDHVPGDYKFDPLGLAESNDMKYMSRMKLGELNNGRLAMVAITAMVAQELNTGINLIPADEVLGFSLQGAPGLSKLEAACAGKPDEAACAKAFEAADRATAFFGTLPTAAWQ